MKRQHTKSDGTRAPGVVRCDELYTLDELKLRLRLGYKGVRTLQQAGLRLLPCGRQKLALGSDVLAFFRHLAKSNEGNSDD